jgi:hypothetical protein
MCTLILFVHLIVGIGRLANIFIVVAGARP